MAQTEARLVPGGRQVPVFFDSTGRRWRWFRFFAILAVVICTFGLLSVVMASYRTPELPSLDLPYHPKLHAIPSIPDGATAAAEPVSTMIE